ncbi:MAG TPA: dihydrodipicolinate reductase C-terminal domain-containing protein [Gemmatimonadaceae bacterium]
MSAPRVAVIGMGKMGRAVSQLATDRGWPVVATLDAEDARGGAGITRATLGDADVAIEFTTPAAAPANIRACARAGCPVVVGTTGWYDHRAAVEADVLAAGGTMLWSPNFSLGVNLFWQIAEMAARLAARVPGFDALIVETHHAAKRDAPSGTAIELARLGSAALGREIPVTSLRVGFVPGTHELLLDAPFEQIRLEHVARDRRVFAEGALIAARWLIGRRGIYTMRDLLLTETPTT